MPQEGGIAPFYHQLELGHALRCRLHRLQRSRIPSPPAGALAFTSVLQSLLYGVSARDPLTYAALAALLALVALTATLLPAWRASRVDPILAIRTE